MKLLAENKKAYFNYEVLEKFEAGIVLQGQEVKSIKSGRMNLAGAYVILKKEEAYLINANVSPCQPRNIQLDYNPSRPRKLLLKKSEIKYLFGKSKEPGLTIIPLKVYTKRDKIKLELGIGRGKKKKNKKDLIRKREAKREMQRELKIRG